MNKEVKLEDIVSLAKRRGFIYQGSEVYGGLSGTWDYGPLGVALKRNIMQLWWKMFVDDREDMFGVDAAILMNQKVWQASGHVDTFTDPLIECTHCNSRFRYDHLVDGELYKTKLTQALKNFLDELHKEEEEQDELKAILEYIKSSGSKSNIIHFSNDFEQYQKKRNLHNTMSSELEKALNMMGTFPLWLISEAEKIKCPVCGSIEWSEPRSFNMMFKTNVGPIENEKSISYLRPETAQGIFTNYKNVLDSFYPDLPFGVAQQGKAFRNEISPRDYIFRSREFEQMEIEYFVHPDKWQEAFEHWVAQCKEWFAALGLPAESVHELEVEGDDRAHYSERTIDFEFDYPIGREELMGLAYRTSFDLDNIQRVSGKSMEYTIKGTNDKFVPHVIEPSFGVERALMAVLVSAYTEDEVNGEKRVYMKFPEHLAPVKYAVSPLLKNKPELVAKAREVYLALKKKHGAVMWDDNGNIGKRYRRQDEIGTPYCVVVDFQTLEDDTVTIRERDTTEQTRITSKELE